MEKQRVKSLVPRLVAHAKAVEIFWIKVVGWSSLGVLLSFLGFALLFTDKQNIFVWTGVVISLCMLLVGAGILWLVSVQLHKALALFEWVWPDPVSFPDGFYDTVHATVCDLYSKEEAIRRSDQPSREIFFLHTQCLSLLGQYTCVEHQFLKATHVLQKKLEAAEMNLLSPMSPYWFALDDATLEAVAVAFVGFFELHAQACEKAASSFETFKESVSSLDRAMQTEGFYS